MDRILMTPGGFKKLDDELNHLRKVERPAIIKAIAQAREHGDLSENAEYHAAREQQSWIEGRIKDVTSTIARAEVVDVTKLAGTVKFGATVTLEDSDGEELTYQIVSEPEADIKKGLLNIKSPLARALIGKDVDDEVKVSTPRGTQRKFFILDIKYL